ncbi:alpha/beta fold hydrolase [Halovenus carboxidivorans]|nr:alpha/beta hydrolase [Halovenus carboxidivorans]
MSLDDAPATAMYRRRAETLTREAGSGPELLCAHGTLMDRTMFDPQIDGLSDEYRVAAYNLRARTERAYEPYDLFDLVEDCRATIDALDMDEPVVAGMSMGGFMAIRLAMEYPEEISGIVLIDSTSRPHPEEDIELYQGMIDRGREDDHMATSMAETVTHFLFGETTREENPELVQSWMERWETYSGEAVYQEVSSWLERPDVTDQLAGVDVPALVVHGEEDESIPFERAEPTVDALDAEQALIPEAGHSSNVERPAAVNDAIREFLADVY